MMKKICENCLEEFETDSGKKRFCSDRCRVAFNRAKDKPEDQKKTYVAPKWFTDKYPNGFPVPARKQPAWVKEIEDYCGSAGILPSDLIEFHRSAHKGVSGKNKGNEVVVKDLTKSNVIGQPYDPMKNPRFLGKISPKKD